MSNCADGGNDAEAAAKPEKTEPDGNASADAGKSYDRELKRAEEQLKSGDVQVVLNFPPDFGDRLEELRAEIKARASGVKPATTNHSAAVKIPEPQLMFNSGKEKSRVAHMQVEQILDAWKSQIVRENLLASRVPANVARPFDLQAARRRRAASAAGADVVEDSAVRAVYLGADGRVLSGGRFVRRRKRTRHAGDAALQPGGADRNCVGQAADGDDVQLCNGDIESGESRHDGPLCDVAVEHDADGRPWPGVEMPPFTSLLWLLAALVPMSALFSALCLACAAFARSTKEGQYYLMPLFLISMPLMMLPLAPGSELNLGNSLIPITGVILLVMGLVQGEYAEVAAVFRARVRGDAHLLPFGDTLGSIPIQPGVGAVPRERAARSAAVDPAPGPRSAGYAVAGTGVFLRRADLHDPVFHAARASRPMHRRSPTSHSWRFRSSSARWCALRCLRC